MPGAGTQGGGDIRVAAEAQVRDEGVAYGRQVLGGVSAANAAGVFLEDHVADVVQAVLDAPVISPPGKQPGRPRLLARHTGDGVFDLGRLLAAAARGAGESTDLGRTGPVEMSAETIRDLQPSMLAAAVLFVGCFGRVKMRDALVFGRRGKKPPETRRRSLP